MNTRKLWSVIFSVVFAYVLLPFARASDVDQQTKVTFDQPVEIPGQVLPAGTYWFVRDRNANNIVRIFSLDWRLHATEFTVDAERLKPADDTILTFAERESSKPEALLKWFYPGETIGHEFLYQKQEERELEQDKQQTVVVVTGGATQVQSGS